MTTQQPNRTPLYSIFIVAAGALMGLWGARDLASPAATIGAAQAGAILAGAALILAGAILAFRPAADPRPPLRYIYGTLLGWLEWAGDRAASPRSVLWLMIPILLLAAALRLYHLTFQSMWLDELMTWWRSSPNDLPTVIRSVESDVWPPGYSLWAYVIIHTVGASDFLLRLPAALAGVMSVAAIYTLGRRLGGQLAGVFGALLLSVLEISIYYSQEARPYSALILFSILSTYFWLRVIEALKERTPGQRTRQRRVPTGILAGAYVLTALLAMYWNYYGLVLVAFQALGAALWLIGRPRTWLAVTGMYGAIALGYLPWLNPMLADLGRDSYLPVRPGGYTDELMAFFRVLFNLEQNYVLAAIGVVAAALIAEGVHASRGKPSRWAAWLVLLGWLILPFTLTYVRSLVSVSTFLHRYLLISLPAAALLPALALARLPVRRWIGAGVMIVAAVILLNNLVRHWDYYTRVTKAQFREAAMFVAKDHPSLGEREMVIGYTGYHGTRELFDFYIGADHTRRRIQLEAGWGASEISAVEAMASDRRIGYIYLIAAQNKPDTGFIDAMMARYRLVEHKEYNQADVWLFAVK